MEYTENKKKQERVAVFQADWALQSQTAYCAIELARSGYNVDLFLRNTPEYYEIDRLRTIPGIKIYLFNSSNNVSLAAKSVPTLKTRFKKWLGLRLSYLDSSLRYFLWLYRKTYASFLDDKDLIPEKILEESQDIINQHDYKCLIGIEKKGLIWAGKIAAESNLPFFYYSLELYTNKHNSSRQSLDACRVKQAEEKYHKLSTATIVQDKERADVLLKDNGIQSSDLIFVPVSLLEEPQIKKTNFLQEKFDLDKGNKVILQFGQINKERFSIDLANIAQNFPKNWILVFHGHDHGSAVQKINEIDTKQRVIVSLDPLPSSEIKELIASADIGLVFYKKWPLNDRLTAFSSEKIALYLQSGIPIIAFDYPGYRELMKKFKCGVTIKSLDELDDAIESILRSYDEFRSGAYECYNEYFRYSEHFKKVVEKISSL